AAAMQAAEGAADTRVEPFVAADGIGILAHGPPRAGETPQAHIRRLADIVGRAFAADALNPDNSTRARTMLLARAGEPDALALAGLGGVLAPNHPSWVDPLGTSLGLGSASTDAIAMRAAAARAGPLRVAVLANADSAQGEAAVRAVDRWVARRPGEGRSCPAVPMLAPPRPGTYAVELPASAPSEAFLALPLVVGDEAERAAATCTAMALDGAGGLLARAVGATVRGDASGKPLAHAWSAAVIGAPRSPALVIRLVAADTSLDAAVAQTRGLLERLHQGALHEEDRARAMAALERDTVAASLDPRARTIDLWRGKFVSSPPSLDALRTFASAVLRDEALIIIALRPARGESERPSAASESRTTSRESSGVDYLR
ncbi:MAG: hypothetical protein M3O46_10130, partial [Myxococcota bacterium]|nr:hypothetical protein [Myxococcota bacterium]